jgi:hypothetical protein
MVLNHRLDVHTHPCGLIKMRRRVAFSSENPPALMLAVNFQHQNKENAALRRQAVQLGTERSAKNRDQPIFPSAVAIIEGISADAFDVAGV